MKVGELEGDYLVTEKCAICKTEFEWEDLIDWANVDDGEDVWGQESQCPECGEPVWIPSFIIEEILSERSVGSQENIQSSSSRHDS